MCQQYHNLNVALIAAADTAEREHQAQYVAHWGGWFGVMNLYELNAEMLAAIYTVLPNHTFFKNDSN